MKYFQKIKDNPSTNTNPNHQLDLQTNVHAIIPI